MSVGGIKRCLPKNKAVRTPVGSKKFAPLSPADTEEWEKEFDDLTTELFGINHLTPWPVKERKLKSLHPYPPYLLISARSQTHRRGTEGTELW
jgi:hypothetical protein